MLNDWFKGEMKRSGFITFVEVVAAWVAPFDEDASATLSPLSVCREPPFTDPVSLSVGAALLLPVLDLLRLRRTRSTNFVP